MPVLLKNASTLRAHYTLIAHTGTVITKISFYPTSKATFPRDDFGSNVLPGALITADLGQGYTSNMQNPMPP